MTPKFYAGISSTQLPETELKDVGAERPPLLCARRIGWALNGNQKYTLQPSVLVKSDGTSTQLDLTATFLYNKMGVAGRFVPLEDAVAPLMRLPACLQDGRSMLTGLQLRCDHIGVERLHSSRSHGVMLNYCFTIEEETRPADLQERQIPLILRNQNRKTAVGSLV